MENLQCVRRCSSRFTCIHSYNGQQCVYASLVRIWHKTKSTTQRINCRDFNEGTTFRDVAGDNEPRSHCIEIADPNLLFGRGCPHGSSIFHNPTIKFTFSLKVDCLQACSSPLSVLATSGCKVPQNSERAGIGESPCFSPFLSHPKFGMNLPRSSQIMLCSPWLSKCKIHLHILKKLFPILLR